MHRRDVLRWAAAVGVLAAVGTGAFRLTGYPDLPTWHGQTLSEREAYILLAAARVVIPQTANAEDLWQAVCNVDTYLTTLPGDTIDQVHMMLNALEHLTALSLRARRFTALGTPGQAAHLTFLRGRGGVLHQLYRGTRDLCLLGHYQTERAWATMGYPGPMVAQTRSVPDAYARLTAPPTSLPVSASQLVIP